MKLRTIVIASCLVCACSKKSDTDSKAKPVEATKVEPAKPKVTLEKLTLTGDWQAKYSANSLDYWTVSKRVTGLTRDPTGYYQYSMMIRLAKPDAPTTEAELAAKAVVDGGLVRGKLLPSVDKTQAVPGGAAAFGPAGTNDKDPTKAFVVVRDLGGTKIMCTSDETSGSSDAVFAEAIAVCASAKL